MWKRQWEGLDSKYTQFGAELLGNYECLRKPKCINMASKNRFRETCPGS